MRVINVLFRLAPGDVAPGVSVSSGRGDPCTVEVRAVLVGGYSAVVGSLMFMILPVLVTAYARGIPAATGSAGAVGSAPMFGMFAGALVSAVLLRSLTTRRSAALLITGMAGAYLAFALSHPLLVLDIGLLFASGMAGAALMAIGFALIARSARPDRMFGLWIACQLAAGAIVVPLLGAVADRFGLSAMMTVLAAVTLTPLATLPWADLPRTGRKSATLIAGDGSRAVAVARLEWALALLAVTLFGAGIMVLWAFMEDIGRATFGGPGEARLVISASLFAGIGAAALSGGLAGRAHRAVIILSATLVLWGGAWLTVSAATPATFLAGGLGLAIGWNAIPASQLGILTQLDSSGRLVVLNIAVMKLGYALGTLVGGNLPSTYGYRVHAMTSLVLLGGSAVLFTWLSTRTNVAANARETA